MNCYCIYKKISSALAKMLDAKGRPLFLVPAELPYPWPDPWRACYERKHPRWTYHRFVRVR